MHTKNDVGSTAYTVCAQKRDLFPYKQPEFNHTSTNLATSTNPAALSTSAKPDGEQDGNYMFNAAMQSRQPLHRLLSFSVAVFRWCTPSTPSATLQSHAALPAHRRFSIKTNLLLVGYSPVKTEAVVSRDRPSSPVCIHPSIRQSTNWSIANGQDAQGFVLPCSRRWVSTTKGGGGTCSGWMERSMCVHQRHHTPYFVKNPELRKPPRKVEH